MWSTTRDYRDTLLGEEFSVPLNEAQARKHDHVLDSLNVNAGYLLIEPRADGMDGGGCGQEASPLGSNRHFSDYYIRDDVAALHDRFDHDGYLYLRGRDLALRMVIFGEIPIDT